MVLERSSLTIKPIKRTVKVNVCSCGWMDGWMDGWMFVCPKTFKTLQNITKHWKYPVNVSSMFRQVESFAWLKESCVWYKKGTIRFHQRFKLLWLEIAKSVLSFLFEWYLENAFFDLEYSFGQLIIQINSTSLLSLPPCMNPFFCHRPLFFIADSDSPSVGESPGIRHFVFSLPVWPEMAVKKKALDP